MSRASDILRVRARVAREHDRPRDAATIDAIATLLAVLEASEACPCCLRRYEQHEDWCALWAVQRAITGGNTSESLSVGNHGDPTACHTAEERGIAVATGSGRLPDDNPESTGDSAERRSPAGTPAAPAPDESNRHSTYCACLIERLRAVDNDWETSACYNGLRTEAADEIERLRQLCAAAYQMAGVVGAPVRFLDALSRHDDVTQEQIDALLPVFQHEFDALARPEAAEKAIERVLPAKAREHIDCWKVNYGLDRYDKVTAARRWAEAGGPSDGPIMALATAIEWLEST